jgi:phosphate transport system permease protein
MAQTRRQRLLTRATDRVARVVITTFGLLMIGSLALIFVLIVGESLPLWGQGRMPLEARTKVGGEALAAGENEYRDLADIVAKDGAIRGVNLRTGAVESEVRPPSTEGLPFAAASRSLHQSYFLGLPDGRVAVVDGRFEVAYDATGRHVKLDLTPVAVLPLDPARRPPVLVSGARRESGAVIAASVPDPGTLLYGFHSEDHGDGVVDLSKELAGERISALHVGEGGEELVVGTESGRLLDFTLASVKQPALTERAMVNGAAPAPVTAVASLLGGQTVLVGDAKGRVLGFQRIRLKADAEERRLSPTHVFEPHGAAVTAISPAPRGKTFVTADANGEVVARYATNERTLASANAGAPVLGLAIGAKADGLVARVADGLVSIGLHSPHPEFSWKALFSRIQYEGYDRPEYVWQSTGGTDDFEPKLSLVPLVFGTVKGTLYAMLFAIPVALSAALYTALFASAGVRAFVKPVVEIMAALPSVVVGFLAGIWLAPMIERHTLGTLLLGPMVPVVILCGALLWERVPARTRRRAPHGVELGMTLVLVVAGGVLCFALAPSIERLVFGGDFKAWLLSALSLKYDTRNCVVIGFAMGLAVVPIIFTISEDALSGVPSSLKAASLALGATPWQTATRVILPTASAGIFSAVMLGLGRAVGETMIVLMATGNTPVLEWSVFNGMRTLAANIAVEISEAPQGGTLYRVLFLAALLLFVLTFVVNTAAEVMRQRLRRKYSVI